MRFNDPESQEWEDSTLVGKATGASTTSMAGKICLYIVIGLSVVACLVVLGLVLAFFIGMYSIFHQTCTTHGSQPPQFTLAAAVCDTDNCSTAYALIYQDTIVSYESCMSKIDDYPSDRNYHHSGSLFLRKIVDGVLDAQATPILVVDHISAGFQGWSYYYSGSPWPDTTNTVVVRNNTLYFVMYFCKDGAYRATCDKMSVYSLDVSNAASTTTSTANNNKHFSSSSLSLLNSLRNDGGGRAGLITFPNDSSIYNAYISSAFGSLVVYDIAAPTKPLWQIPPANNDTAWVSLLWGVVNGTKYILARNDLWLLLPNGQVLLATPWQPAVYSAPYMFEDGSALLLNVSSSIYNTTTHSYSDQPSVCDWWDPASGSIIKNITEPWARQLCDKQTLAWLATTANEMSVVNLKQELYNISTPVRLNSRSGNYVTPYKFPSQQQIFIWKLGGRYAYQLSRDGKAVYII